MTTILNVLHEFLEQVAILFITLLATYILAVLLDTPNCPKSGVGLLHFMDVNTDGLIINKVAKRLFCGAHVSFKCFSFAD